MSKVEKAVQWMENTAKNDIHGYDQKYRWGEKGDYDCSAAVITAYQTAGVPVKTNGATYTGNMLKAFKKSGFVDVTSSINLKTGAGLIRGDVLLSSGHHTAMYCGNGKEVEASINEKGKTVGGQPGDQTGKEFLIRAYRNYPWTNVLRYPEEINTAKKSVDEIAREVLNGEWGNGTERKERLISAGYDYADVQRKVNELVRFKPSSSLSVGDTVKVINAVTYKGSKFKCWYETYTVMELSGDRAVIGVNGVVTAAVNTKNICKV